MLESNVSVITAFAIYLLAMLLIGVYYSRSQRHLSDYILAVAASVRGLRP